MSYTPKTEEQLAKEGLFPKGIYDVEVAEASDEVSKKSGNDMIKLKLNVFDDTGSLRVIYDYIVFGTNFGERKFRHAADAFGLLDKYSSGNLRGSDFINQSGKAEIIQQDAQENYPAKNSVGDYIGREEATIMQEQTKAVKKAPKAKQELDDSIPW